VNKALDILSLIGSFLVVFGILFLIQDQSVGRINFLKQLTVFEVIRFKHLLFAATSIFFILRYIKFYLPDRSDHFPDFKNGMVDKEKARG
jgi:hypothetical protein